MAGHNANAYPEDHLYVKSPAETEAVVLAGIDDARVSYQSSQLETERAYRHRAGVADPNPPIGTPTDADDAPPEPVTEAPPAEEAPAPAPPPAPRSTKKPSSTKK
jgi:hypothetical protein